MECWVRQGENLSPFPFVVYIDDLDNPHACTLIISKTFQNDFHLTRVSTNSFTDSTPYYGRYNDKACQYNSKCSLMFLYQLNDPP
jgi:hypothetical protein